MSCTCQDVATWQSCNGDVAGVVDRVIHTRQLHLVL